MGIRIRLTKSLALAALVTQVSCVNGSGDLPKVLRTTKLKNVTIAHFSGWPKFLLAVEPDLLLLGDRRGVVRVENLAGGAAIAVPAHLKSAESLDRLLAAARNSAGTLAFLDANGQITLHVPHSARTWSFGTNLNSAPGRLALSADRVYLLLQDEFASGEAVVAFTFQGVETGRWGEVPADGIIQASLGGGGVVACPDGSVFYSYINSPRIYGLPDGTRKRTRQIGKKPGSFQVVSANKVHEANEQSMRARSVAPLVKLGFSASRVMALTCSEEGLLFRQVASPGGAGAHIEVWDPSTEELVDIISIARGILLDARSQILYLGTLSQSRVFGLDRIRYQVEVDPQEAG